MAIVKPGSRVPRFTIPTTDGEFRMGSDAEQNLVLYFYPRDDTPGCTAEGSDFGGLAPAFRRLNTRILGISTDTLESHRRFRDKMKFPFELGADTDHSVADLFGVWKQKNLYGRKSMGIERSTFLIDAGGVLRREWRKVRVAGHAAEVLAAAREI
ncbi:MAG: peroxiredoxin [Gemmatimonadetes bacterium]|nr:peroxiredoxin [Gemmatimonadota bacterium]